MFVAPPAAFRDNRRDMIVVDLNTKYNANRSCHEEGD